MLPEYSSEGSHRKAEPLGLKLMPVLVALSSCCPRLDAHGQGEADAARLSRSGSASHEIILRARRLRDSLVCIGGVSFQRVDVQKRYESDRWSPRVAKGFYLCSSRWFVGRGP